MSLTILHYEYSYSLKAAQHYTASGLHLQRFIRRIIKEKMRKSRRSHAILWKYSASLLRELSEKVPKLVSTCLFYKYHNDYNAFTLCQFAPYRHCLISPQTRSNFLFCPLLVCPKILALLFLMQLASQLSSTLFFANEFISK